MAVVEAQGGFDSPEINASPCEFRIKLPPIFVVLNFEIPTIQFPPALPFPIFNLSLSLSCSLDNPIDVSGGLEFGGGRIPAFDPDPDDQDDPPGDGSREVGGF